jgi:hypothetical protein
MRKTHYREGGRCPVDCGMPQLKHENYAYCCDRILRRQYAYDPSHTPQQSGGSDPQQGTSYQQQTRSMMPPPPPMAHGAFPSTGSTGDPVVSSHARGQLLSGGKNQARQSPQMTTFVSNTPHLSAPLPSNRFTPRASTSHTPSGCFVPQTPGSRRFVPATTTAGSRVHSRAGNPNPATQNGQRTPFFPRTRLG